MSKNKKKKKKVQSTQPTEKKQELKFNCLRCGKCCIDTTPSFTKDEYKKVRDLKITRDRNIKLIKKELTAITRGIGENHIQHGYSYFTENSIKKLEMGVIAAQIFGAPPCEFLDKNDDGKYSCAIYPYRPSVCRDYGIKEWTCPNNPDFLLKKLTK